MELTPEQEAAVEAKQALLKAEAFLVSLKDSADEEQLRGVKNALRAQRQEYREKHRSHIIALEMSGDIIVTPDSVEIKSA